MLPAVENTTRAAVILTLRGRTEISSTFVSVLQRYAETLRAHDSKLLLAGVDEAVYSQPVRSHRSAQHDRRGTCLHGDAAIR